MHQHRPAPLCRLPFNTNPPLCANAPAMTYSLCHTLPPFCFPYATMNSFVEWQAPLSSNKPRPDSIVPVRVPLLEVNPQGGVSLHVPHIRDMSPHQTVQRDPLETASNGSSATDPRFFSLVQAHMAESVLSASVATSTTSQSAKPPSSGMVQCPLLEKTSKGTWSQRTASCFASTGKSQRAADPQATQNNTDARDVGKPIMGPRVALEWRKLEPCTPYNKGAWAEQLWDLGLWEKYSHLVQGFAIGFDLGIPHITHTHTPPNHSSVTPLFNVYSSIIDSEFAAGQYIGPFTCHQLELALGPFQTSPLSLVPKASKPGMYQAVHNFSHPHDASHNVSSINSHINCDDFLCIWGTFVTVALLIARLPPGSQASVRDVAEAYRTIPAILLRSVGRSVRLGRWGVCPECRQGVERICRAITKQVQRSDARIEVDVMHTWNECTE
jgi:hypothetical protein